MGDSWVRQLSTLALGAILLTAWDLVLDPAMSQTNFPFWQFQEVGQFFGMPYRNLVGWMGTGFIFMGVGAFLWRRTPIVLSRSQLTLPLIVYITNFFFGAAITVVELDARFLFPVALSILFGLIPAIIFWWNAKPSLDTMESLLSSDNITPSTVEAVVK
jgi:putative membrane protein